MSERRTPYDLVFADTPFESEIFPAIREEADVRGVDTGNVQSFAMLGTVGAFMHDLGGEGDPGASISELSLFVYHSWHFWQSGKNVLSVSEPDARAAVRAEPIGDWQLHTPFDSGYAQLPHFLFWAYADPHMAAESVDGFFWHVVPGEGRISAAYAQGATPSRLELLLVLGVRNDRPGFSLIRAADDLPAAGHWGDEQMRETGEDFANVLPGGEIQQLQSITTPGEALKLASRLFRAQRTEQ